MVTRERQSGRGIREGSSKPFQLETHFIKTRASGQKNGGKDQLIERYDYKKHLVKIMFNDKYTKNRFFFVVKDLFFEAHDSRPTMMFRTKEEAKKWANAYVEGSISKS